MRITLNRVLSQELIKNLEQSRYVGNVKQALRYEAILLISNGNDLNFVSNFCRNTLRNIYYWLSIFIVKKVEGLRIKKSSGRKSKLTKADKNELKEMLLKSPEYYGFESGVWTSAMIQALIFRTFNVEYSTGYICQLLRDMGLSHKKMDIISHKCDKNLQKEFVKKTFPETVFKALRQKGVILFQDESTFRQWSRSAYNWGLKGEKLIGKVNMSSNTQRVFGCISHEGDFIYKLTDACNNETFYDFMHDIVEKFNGRKVFMFIDNSKIHSSTKIDKFLLNNRNLIEFVRLPKYSPMLNPIEKLWKKVKLNFMHNRFFENKESFIYSLKSGLKYFSKNIDTVSSVMSKWLKIFSKIELEFNKKCNSINNLKLVVI